MKYAHRQRRRTTRVQPYKRERERFLKAGWRAFRVFVKPGEAVRRDCENGRIGDCAELRAIDLVREGTEGLRDDVDHLVESASAHRLGRV